MVSAEWDRIAQVSAPNPDPSDTAKLQRRHLRFGWWSLLAFLTLGIGLEGLHGFKVGWYLDVANEARRLSWTLSHAHGTLLALIHLAFAYTLGWRPAGGLQRQRVASGCLLGASVLLPGGFFLGGIVIYDGDPGLAILLVPVGGALLLAGVGATAWDLSRSGPGTSPPSSTASGS